MVLITTLFTLMALAGPQTPAPQPPPSRSTAPAEYVAGPQDVLNIVVFGEEDLTKTVALDADGTFDYPYVGRIKAGGLTARAIGEEIAKKLKNFYVNPQVSVEVAKFRSQNIFVFGQVHAPGQYPLSGNMSILQALAAAGSPTAAAASYVVISRPAGSEPRLPTPESGGGTSLRITMRELQSGQMPTGFALRDGDTVTIPKAETIFVTGQVKIPGPYVIEGELTVMQAIAMAGGATDKGAPNRVRIFRTVDGKQQEVKGVKLSDPVKAGDTIDVPQRYF
jgi:polysaccharide export outer membrane protein